MPLNSVALLLTIFINAILAITVYLKAKKNTSTLFFFFIILGIFLWATPLYYYNFTNNQQFALSLSKISYFGAAFSMMSVFGFVIFFNSKIKNLYRRYFLIVFDIFTIGLLFFIIIKNSLLKSFLLFNKERIINFGSLYPMYIAFISLLCISSFFILYKKHRNETNLLKKIQLKYIFIGLLIAIAGGIITNLILPSFSIFNFYWLGPIFTLGIVIFITLAIMRHHLFDIKIIATQLLVFIIWVLLLGRLLLARTWQQMTIDGILLVFVILFGILLIRSVLKEVRTREELQVLTTKLKEANVRLKKLDEAKSEFISIASHQLRTPLTAIKGYSSMLLEGAFGKLPKEAKIPVGRIFRSSKSLVELVGEFLNLSRIERGKLEYNFERINLRELATDTIDGFRAAGGNDIDIIFEADEKEDFTINADRNKIQHILSNLIDNAIKYTPKGFVKIYLYKNHERETITLKVKDSGIGMSRETLARIFEKFTRARDGISQINTEGLGMGLYIAKKISRGHGGDIWAESEGEGKGSAFYVELPVDFSPPRPEYGKFKEKKHGGGKSEKIKEFMKSI